MDQNSRNWFQALILHLAFATHEKEKDSSAISTNLTKPALAAWSLVQERSAPVFWPESRSLHESDRFFTSPLVSSREMRLPSLAHFVKQLMDWFLMKLLIHKKRIGSKGGIYLYHKKTPPPNLRRFGSFLRGGPKFCLQRSCSAMDLNNWLMLLLLLPKK